MEHNELLDDYDIMDGTTHSEDYEQYDDEKTDDLTACTIKSLQESNILIDLEQFIISNDMHEDANCAHRLLKITNECADSEWYRVIWRIYISSLFWSWLFSNDRINMDGNSAL